MAVVSFVGAGVLLSSAAVAAPGDVIGPINPVAQPLGGHPANSGFLVFVEGDVELNADEAEGTIALGGDLSFLSAYNIAAGAAPPPTFIAPGDSAPTYIYVGGGVRFPDDAGLILRVLNGGLAKIADTTTYDAFDTDQNNTPGLPYHVVPPGGAYGTQPRIEGMVTQSPESIATPVPGDLIDIPGAFALYRDTSATLQLCTPTIEFTNRDDGAPLTAPYADGTAARLTLVEGETNVVTIAASDLDALSEITFEVGPSPDTPLLVNVTGDAFEGTVPNLAGLSSLNAPYLLWNFPEATSVTVTGGDSIEGTIYAPYAAFNWQVTQNIEGNVIAASFIHGSPAVIPGSPREVHSFPFAAELTCVEGGVPTTPPITTPPVTPPETTTPAETPGSTTALPATGANPLAPLLGAAGLAAVGVAAIGVGYRRRA